MSSIYEYIDYRILIEDRAKVARISYRELAQNAGIHTSYFSRVMTGKADFSSEQLFQIGRGLQLSAEEVEYLLLLGESSRSGNREHQSFLKTRISEIRDEKLRLGNKLQSLKTKFTATAENISAYYQEAITGKVHMALTVERYRSNPPLIAKKLGISETKLEFELSKLEGLKIIDREASRIKVLTDSIHLDESHPSTSLNLVNWRLDSINKISRRENRPSDYHMSVVFSCDEATKIRIKELYKEFVVKAQHTVGASASTDDVFQMNFDLY